MTLESLEGKRSFRNRRLMRAQLLPVSLTDRQTASLAGQSSRAFSSSSTFKKDRSGVFPLKIHCHKPYRNCAHSVLITVKKKLGCTHTPQVLISGTKCSAIMLMPGLPLKKIWVKIEIQLSIILFLDNLFNFASSKIHCICNRPMQIPWIPVYFHARLILHLVGV